MVSLFVFGLGYSTAAVARQAQQQHGWSVTSTSRQPTRFSPLQSAQHRLAHFDPGAKVPLDDAGVEALQSADYVLTSIPPVAAKLYDPVLAAQHRALRQATEAGRPPAGIGYLSSTGVYGDWGGDWVDESSEPRTATARGLLRLEAEQAWAQLAQQLQLPLTVFRLGGIYGPWRSVFNSIQSQGPTTASAARRGRQRFTSRCHVADVAQAVLADVQRRAAGPPPGSTQAVAPQAAQQGGPGGDALCSPWVDVVNVVDDEPAPRGDVEEYAQQLLRQRGEACDSGGPSSSGSTPGPTAPAQPPAQQQQQTRRAGSGQEPLEEKRVRNVKLKQLLHSQYGPGTGLCAPTYREGLQLILEGVDPFVEADLLSLYGPL